MKVVLGFIAAVVATYVFAAVSYSQLNLASLVEMGLVVDAGTRLKATVHDLGGLALIYLPIIAVGLLIAFGVARLVLIWVPQLRTIGYMLAGFVALYTVEYALGNVVASGTHPLHITMTTVGLLSQCIAGAIGGYVFVLMTRQTAEQ